MSVGKRSLLWRHFQEVDGNFFIDTYMLPYILTQETSGEWPVITVVWLSGGGRRGKLEVNALIRRCKGISKGVIRIKGLTLIWKQCRVEKNY